jgi:hypothetical protein
MSHPAKTLRSSLSTRPCAVLLALAGALLALLLSAAGASAAACPNEAIRTEQGSGYLPNCRAYEMVSPVEKNGQEVEVPEQFDIGEVPFRASDTGAGAAFTLTGGIPGSESGALYIPAAAASAAPGSSWSTTSLAPESTFTVLPGAGPRSGGEYPYFAPDLSCAVLQTRLAQARKAGDPEPLLAPGETAEEAISNMYVVNRATGERTLVTSKRPANPELTSQAKPYFVDGASTGCSHVLYDTVQAGYELPGTPTGSMVEWTEASGPRVASVLPDGTDAATVQPVLAGSTTTGSSNVNEMSSDGSRVFVFFTAQADGGLASEKIDQGAFQVYVRENATTTVEASASQTAVPVRDTGAVYQGATKDGSRVFFLANYGLTETSSSGAEAAKVCTRNAKGGINAGTGCDLYEYNTSAKKLVDLSADIEAQTTDKKGANARGVVGFSEDGSYVYFSASGKLVAGGRTQVENEANKEANVYAYHEGHISYVTTIGELEAGGGGSGGPPSAETELDAINNSAGSGVHFTQSRVSPNGQYLLLVTAKKVTAYNNIDRVTHEPDPEFYTYKYTEGAGPVHCISCEPSGEQPLMLAPVTFTPQGPFLTNYDGVVANTLLNDGRAFFESTDPLVAQAVRPGGAQTVDVYGWTPVGTAGCEAPTGNAEGCVNILDSGHDTYPSYLVGSSLDGSNVYLTAKDQLAPGIDVDHLRDLYDVRIGGGIPAPPAATNCEEQPGGCQGPYTPPGGPGAHTSETGAGGGQVTPLPPSNGGGVLGFTAEAVKIMRHSTKGTTLTLIVSIPGSGRLSVSGSGLIALRRSLTKGGSYAVKVSLTPKGRAAVKRHKRVRVNVTVGFAPASGRASSAHTLVIFG